MHRISRRNRQSVLVVSSFSLSISVPSLHVTLLLFVVLVSFLDYRFQWLRRNATALLCVHPPPPLSTIHPPAENSSNGSSLNISSGGIGYGKQQRIAHITANLSSSCCCRRTSSHCWLFNYFLILPEPGLHSNEALPINHCVLLRGDKPMRMCPVANNESDQLVSQFVSHLS